MKPVHQFVLVVCVAVASSQTACVATAGDEEGDDGEGIAEAQQEARASNSLTINGLTTNGLTTNGLTTNGLTTNGLTTNGLTTNALRNPAAREVLQFITSCALPPRQHLVFQVDGTTYRYNG